MPKPIRSITRLLSILFVAAIFIPAAGSGPTTIMAQDAKAGPQLKVRDKLAGGAKELFIETSEWLIGFSLNYNGGVFEIQDKVADPERKDNLVASGYGQGGIFDYNVYLSGNLEFTTAVGRNPKRNRESLTVLENTPARVRLRQICHPRLNSGGGPVGDPYVELDMVKTTTDWTFYPTGRVCIRFDAVLPPEWKGIVSQGPGRDGPGIIVDGDVVRPLNGVNFTAPWVTAGDTIESKSGGWGPYEISRRERDGTLRLAETPPPGDKLDFVIKRPFITNETISIHGDGDSSIPRQPRWQGGSNGEYLFSKGKMGDVFRGAATPVSADYVIAHWTLPPRGFGCLLAFYEPYNGANYAVINDYTYGDISYTQVGRNGKRPFEEHHRHLMAQLGIENATYAPRIKGIPDALPFADDYRSPWAAAKTGTLNKGEGISKFGFHVPTGAYQITAGNGVAAIAFDAARGKTVKQPLAYFAPAVLVFGIDAADEKIIVELSEDNGKTFKVLPASDFNITSRVEATQLGGNDRRLIQYLGTVPATATGANAWVLRIKG
jgi:hypothetical protein